MALGVHPCALQVLSTSKSISSAEAANDLNIKWDIARELSRDLDIVWNITIEVSRDLLLTWDIKEDVTTDLKLIWNIVSELKVDLDVVWNITDKKAFVVNKNRYCAGGASRVKPFCG